MWLTTPHANKSLQKKFDADMIPLSGFRAAANLALEEWESKKVRI